jgi:hypothetical protein
MKKNPPRFKVYATLAEVPDDLLSAKIREYLFATATCQDQTAPANNPRIRDLAELIGVAGVIKVLRWRGGQKTYIPALESITPDHPFAKAIGYSEARLLSERNGRGHVLFPGYMRLLAAINTELVLTAAKAKSLSKYEISRILGVSERHVFKLLAMEKSDPAWWSRVTRTRADWVRANERVKT